MKFRFHNEWGRGVSGEVPVGVYGVMPASVIAIRRYMQIRPTILQIAGYYGCEAFNPLKISGFEWGGVGRWLTLQAVRVLLVRPHVVTSRRAPVIV